MVRSILLNNLVLFLFFCLCFFIMLFKCVNLYVKRNIFQKLLPVGDRTQSENETGPRLKTQTDRPRHVFFVLHGQEGIHVSGHHNASNLS